MTNIEKITDTVKDTNAGDNGNNTQTYSWSSGDENNPLIKMECQPEYNSNQNLVKLTGTITDFSKNSKGAENNFTLNRFSTKDKVILPVGDAGDDFSIQGEVWARSLISHPGMKFVFLNITYESERNIQGSIIEIPKINPVTSSQASQASGNDKSGTDDAESTDNGGKEKNKKKK